MNVGQRIQERRKELKMSVETLANKIGKSRATVYRYENGDIEKLPLDGLGIHFRYGPYSTTESNFAQVLFSI